MIPKLVAPLRRLPIPLPPVNRETWATYLRRLARINHVDPLDLEETLAFEKRKFDTGGSDLAVEWISSGSP